MKKYLILAFIVSVLGYGAGTDSYEAGGGSASGDNSIAIGIRTVAYGKNTISIGKESRGNGDNTIVIGEHSIADRASSIIIGEGSKASSEHGIIIGNSAVSVKDRAISIGYNSTTEGKSSISIGEFARTKGENSVAIGYNSLADLLEIDGKTKGESEYKDETISIGSKNIELKNFAGGKPLGVFSIGGGKDRDSDKEINTRRVQYVSSGLIAKNSTDAINGSQLYSTITSLVGEIDKVQQKNEINRAEINEIKNDINIMGKETNAGIATAMAIGNLPQSTSGDMLVVGVASYKAQNAIAVGYSRISKDERQVVKLATSFSSGGIGVAASFGIKLGK